MKTICFTGHRKFEGQVSNTPTHDWVRGKIGDAISRAASNGFTTFITGGAIGTDTIAALEVLNFRAGNQVSLILAIPCEGQEKKWSNDSQRLYRQIATQANEVIHVNQGPYEPWKMMARNRWMVDRVDCIIAVWDGRRSGGTYQTIEYAKSEKKPILLINPITGKEYWDNREWLT